MKKICGILWCIAIIMVFFAISFPIVAHAGNFSEIYPLCGIVKELNFEKDTVIVEDFGGRLWEFPGIEDWMENDICAMIMYRNGTFDIFDDIVIDTRYCGWIE